MIILKLPKHKFKLFNIWTHPTEHAPKRNADMRILKKWIKSHYEIYGSLNSHARAPLRQHIVADLCW
jgi:hypothetical protein